MRTMIVVLAVTVIAGCPLGPNAPPVEPDYPPLLATPEGACINLERLGCSEAKTSAEGISCVHAFRRMSELTDPHLDCVSSARDVAKVRSCGSVRCR